MNVSTIVDITFASMMLLGGCHGLVRMHHGMQYLPRNLANLIINHSLKQLFTFGWDSRYHLMALWNLTCLAAIIHWNLWYSASAIATLYVMYLVDIAVLKYRLSHEAAADQLVA